MEQSKNLTEVKNRLWLCMKECLTYSWQCLIYTDKVRKKKARHVKIARALIYATITSLSSFFIIKWCQYGLDIITMLIGICLTFVSGIFFEFEYCKYSRAGFIFEKETLDELGGVYRDLYQRYCNLYLQCCNNDDKFDMSVNDEIDKLVHSQDRLLIILNMLCISLSKTDEEEINKRVEQTLKEIFYNDVEQCPERD